LSRSAARGEFGARSAAMIPYSREFFLQRLFLKGYLDSIAKMETEYGVSQNKAYHKFEKLASAPRETRRAASTISTLVTGKDDRHPV
jgi:hypothetical protein